MLSNMDYNDLWKVTIVPSVISQPTSSNDTITSLTRTLSTISERESKQDFYLPFDENERKKDTYKNAERSKIISLSPTCQKLNHDYLHSFKSDKQLISVLRRNEKESHDQIKDKLSKGCIRSQMYKDINNTSDAPFVELRAIYKILDFITDSDPKVSSLTNNCCNEISRILQCLLAQSHDKKLEDLLLNDSSLQKCERCGVISYVLESKTRHSETIIAERDCANNDQNNEQSEILISPPDLINNVQSRINDSKVNNQIEYKDELSEIKSPIKERAFVMKRYVENSSKANNISAAEAYIRATIKNKFYPDNEAIKKLFTDLETEKKNEKHECNSAVQNNRSKHDSSNAMNAYASSIDREEVMREILYEPKSQINDLTGDRRFISQKIQACSTRLFDKYGDIYPIVDTVKYLARGQFTELDKKEDEFLSKLQERRYTRLDDTRNERSSILYGSREDYSPRAGFWLFDELGHLPQIALDKYCYPPMPRTDNNRVNISFPANISRYSHMAEKKTGRWSDYMEKDSLEDCTHLEQGRESNATIFSSSSVENLISGFPDRKLSHDCSHEINNIYIDEDISRGRKLVSSRPSLDIARHVRAQIAKERHSSNAKESIDKLCTHDSNILVQLSPETRRKICHLIKTIVTSKKNSTLNSEKLLHSKSADATFAHSKYYKTDNEVTNIFADDCTPTKLSELSENKNRLLKRQDNFVNIRSQNLNKSKDSVKIFHENMTPVSSDKSVHNSKKIMRQIVYKDALKNVIGNNDGHMMAEILSIYHQILKNSEDMDWENFRKFVEVLHPDEKELWRDVCRTISEEAKRISGDADDNTEICIEISPISPEETLKTSEVITGAREIVFELNMTLKDVDNFLKQKIREEVEESRRKS